MVQKIERVEITNDLCIEMISWKKDLQSHCKCNVIVISKNDGFRVIIYASENYILANYLMGWWNDMAWNFLVQNRQVLGANEFNNLMTITYFEPLIISTSFYTNETSNTIQHTKQYMFVGYYSWCLPQVIRFQERYFFDASVIRELHADERVDYNLVFCICHSTWNAVCSI